MKKVLSVFVIMAMMLSLQGCSKVEAEKPQEKIKAVKVSEVQKSTNDMVLSYIGTVDSKTMTDYSFKSGGKVSNIYVEKGDHVKKGEALARLDMTDNEIQVEATKLSMETANENVKKAKDALDFQTDQFDKMSKLYESGAIAKDSFDQVKLQLDNTIATYNQSKLQYDAAALNYKNASIVLDESLIRSKEDGIIMDVVFEEAERVGPSQTIVSLRSMNQIINVGISQSDLKRIKEGTKAEIDVDGEKAKGVITSIDEAPDMATRTYNAEVYVDGKNYRLGSIAKIKFDVGKENGVWIPLQVIFSNGEDYVYVVNEDRAFKRTISIVKNIEDKVLVEGLEAGEFIAVNGMKNLNDGSKVNIVD